QPVSGAIPARLSRPAAPDRCRSWWSRQVRGWPSWSPPWQAPAGIRPMTQKLLTRAAVAQLLGISLRSVDRLRERGLLPGLKVLTSVRFREQDVQEFINGRPEGDKQNSPA